MKPRYIYSLFIIVIFIPVIALIGIDMMDISSLSYIKIVALLMLFLSFVSMAIVMTLYMKFIDKDKNDIVNDKEESSNQSEDKDEKTDLGSTIENSILDEEKALFKDLRNELDDERKVRHQVENEKANSNLTTNNVLEEVKSFLCECKESIAEELGNIRKNVESEKATNQRLLAQNEALTKEKSALEKDKTDLQNSLNGERIEKQRLLGNNEKLMGEKSALEKDKVDLQATIDAKKAENQKLVDYNKKLTEYARYGLNITALLKNEDVDPRAYLAKLKSVFSECKPMHQHARMCEELEVICNEASKTTPMYNNLLALRDNMIRSFKEKLQLQTPPLEVEVKRNNLTKLINISIVAFDLMDTMEYSVNNTESQKLSVEIALGLKDLETEITQCEQVDMDPNKTPNWLRALKSTLESTGVDLSRSIISGRRL